MRVEANLPPKQIDFDSTPQGVVDPWIVLTGFSMRMCWLEITQEGPRQVHTWDVNAQLVTSVPVTLGKLRNY
jgi:hypothetical protein